MSQPNSQALVYVVIPNWNGKKLMGDVLDSLKSQTYKNFKILVVDNGSGDGSADFIRKHYPFVNVLELGKNHGFSGGVNAGIKYALAREADYVALLNNDARADPKWLTELVKRMQVNPKIGIVTGKLLQFPKTTFFDSSGDFYSIWGMPFPRGRDEPDTAQYEKAEPVPAASGGASLYRRELFKDIGLFDEDFFAYYEDVDISLRTQLAGWKIWYQPTAVAYHQIGATSSKLSGFARYHSIKNYYYLYYKNLPLGLYFRYLPRFIITNFLVAANSLRRLQIVPLLKAYGRLIITCPKFIIKRWQVQHQRRITPAEFDGLLYRQIAPTHKNLQRLARRVRSE